MSPLRSTAYSGDPDWVMVGVPGPLDEEIGGGQGVWLFASKDLTRAELEAEIPRLAYDIWQQEQERLAWMTGSIFPPPLPPPRPEYKITATMRKFIVIQARTYPEAFKALFDKWSPEPDAPPALEGQRAIEGGPQWPPS